MVVCTYLYRLDFNSTVHSGSGGNWFIDFEIPSRYTLDLGSPNILGFDAFEIFLGFFFEERVPAFIKKKPKGPITSLRNTKTP
jgi:hypothetical protein